MNLALWLQRNARIHGGRPAVAHGTRVTWRYADFADGVMRAARGLRALGLQPGDRIGIFMANAPDVLLALWGAWWAGLVVGPVNARLHGREAAWILQHSGARACVVDAAHAKGLSVEAELGVLSGIEEDVKAAEHVYTQPDEAVQFVKATKCDSLACAIGTSARSRRILLSRNCGWS